MIEGKPYIFLEYVPGADIEKELQKGAFDVLNAVELAIQFCDGMNYAHQKLGLVHRDIKPANCLITREGILKITDFGLGTIVDTPLLHDAGSPGMGPRNVSDSSSSGMVGTLLYMAPEIFTKKSSGIKTDIYAFGVVLYEMLTGENPFQSEDPSEMIMSQVSMMPEIPAAYNAEIPPRLGELVLQCLAKDPGERFDGFDHIMRELEDIYNDMTGLPYIDYQENITFTEDDWYNKGVSLLSLGCCREAILSFDRGLGLNPSSLPLIIQKASALTRSGRPAEALACIEQGRKMTGEDWRVWFQRAEALWKQGDADGALESFDEALRHTDDEATVLGRMGVLLAGMGSVAEALECFDGALSHNPRAGEIWDEKGYLLIQQHFFEEALECLNTALELNPRSLSALYRHGLVLFNLGFFSRAVESLKKR